MNYQQTIDYIFTRLPMFSRIGPAAIKKDLTNTIALCDYIQNPQTSFKSVHIAGTNGKGSTSHMLASVFQAAGYKTGLYTSPHLKDFRERIKINGEMIDEKAVVDFMTLILPMIDKVEPSFFEITVAMAFQHFAINQVDVAIIEVGLGGRLDSTNIITPVLSVITNIGYDHMNLLGNTLKEIATEKAGIIKKGVPVVIGEFQPEISSVFDQKAAASEAPVAYANRGMIVEDWKMDNRKLTAEITYLHSNEKENFILDLASLYQTKNLVTVLEAVHQLRGMGWVIHSRDLHRGLSQVSHLTGFHGRWEQIHQQPIVVLDVGHNAEGIAQMTRQIEITDHEELHIVIGIVKDKEIDKMLSLLPKNGNYYFTKAQIPRAMPENQLLEMANRAGLAGKAYRTVQEALQAAFTIAHKRDLILVCGSVFVVGEVDFSQIRK